MTFIKDERSRMIEHLNNSLRICNGSCSNCATKDERLYDGPIVGFLRKEYGMVIGDVGILTEAVCPLGITLGKRIEKYAKNNSPEYRNEIISSAKSIQKNSVGSVNPEKIRSDMSFLRAYLNLSKEKTPTTTNETLESLSTEVGLPKIPKVAHVTSRMTRKLSKKLIDLL